MGQGVQGEEELVGFRGSAPGIDDWSDPEEGHEEGAQELGHVAEEDVQRRDHGGQPVGHEDLDREEGEDQDQEPEVGQLGDRQHHQEDGRPQQLVHEGRDQDAEGKRLQRKSLLLDDGGVLDEGPGGANDTLLNGHPGQQGREEIQREDPGGALGSEPMPQDEREDQRVESQLQSRIQNRPEQAGDGAHVTAPDIPGHKFTNQVPVAKKRTQHGAGGPCPRQDPGPL